MATAPMEYAADTWPPRQVALQTPHSLSSYIAHWEAILGIKGAGGGRWTHQGAWMAKMGAS